MAERVADHLTDDDQRALDGVSEAIDLFGINPGSMLPAYLQLATILRATIIVRRLPAGAPLPSEPELTEQYRVSRDTVRKAMRVLREVGLAETRRGVGHFVMRAPDISRIVVQPGSRVIVRMPLPEELGRQLGLGLVVFVVTEPGKPPVSYDTGHTLLVFEG